MKKFVSVFLFSVGLSLAIPGSVYAAQPEFAQKNHPSYWGDSCYKIENFSGDIKTYTVDDNDATLAVVKGGPEFKVYENGPFASLTAAVNPKNHKTYGISHVIVCTDKIEEMPDQPDETPEEEGNTAADTDINNPSISGTSTEAKELPATGVPMGLNMLVGGLIGIISGALHLTSRKRQHLAQWIDEVAL